jgi:hypothetical protein
MGGVLSVVVVFLAKALKEFNTFLKTEDYYTAAL